MNLGLCGDSFTSVNAVISANPVLANARSGNPRDLDPTWMRERPSRC